ncbi:MAG: hypothetical protein ACRDKS_05750, partial [Actinomycetota bacterium]
MNSGRVSARGIPILRTPLYRLPLLAKMLIPFIALTVAVGVFGVLFVTRDLSTRAEDALGDDLSRRVVEARSFLHERELYALESANYAANLTGMAAAIRARDQAAVGRLLGSVLALKGELTLTVATGLDGIGIAELRSAGSARPVVGRGGQWREHPFVAEALRSSSGDRTAGTITGAPAPMLAVAAPVCAGTKACQPVGVAIVGIPAASLLSAGSPGSTSTASEGRALFNTSGATLTSQGIAIPPPAGSGAIRQTIQSGGRQVAAMYAPFSLRGRAA